MSPRECGLDFLRSRLDLADAVRRTNRLTWMFLPRGNVKPYVSETDVMARTRIGVQPLGQVREDDLDANTDVYKAGMTGGMIVTRRHVPREVHD